MTTTNLFKAVAVLGVILISNFSFAQELAHVEIKATNYSKVINDLSNRMDYPEIASNNLEEGVVTMKFVLNAAYGIERMEMIGETGEELKTATQKSLVRYISEKGSSLQPHVVYEIPVKYVLE